MRTRYLEFRMTWNDRPISINPAFVVSVNSIPDAVDDGLNDYVGPQTAIMFANSACESVIVQGTYEQVRDLIFGYTSQPHEGLRS